MSKPKTMTTKTNLPAVKVESADKRADKVRRFSRGLRATGGRYTQPGPAIDASLGRLLEMLTYKRPAGSATEQEFIARFIYPLEPWKDSYGNLIIQVGDHPNILWSCHTDTVHQVGGRQRTFVSGPMVYVDGGGPAWAQTIPPGFGFAWK